jgi:hypothetical protein
MGFLFLRNLLALVLVARDDWEGDRLNHHPNIRMHPQASPSVNSQVMMIIRDVAGFHE